jgi:hypothetical protein
MENLPVEITFQEIGKYLDVPSMISMSFVNKDFQRIYQPYFSKIVKEIDPYIENGTVNDYLNITKIGTIENVVYKIWKNIFDTIIREVCIVNPTHSRKQIVDLFQKVIPVDAIELLRENIKKFIQEHERFMIFKNVVYRNPTVSNWVSLTENFETDINDMMDVLLHEIACQSTSISRENSLDSLTDDSNQTPSDESETVGEDYDSYENVICSVETFIKYL